MTPYHKGNLGEIAVAKELMRQGLHVFTEMGTGSKIDMIAADQSGRLHRVQCKATHSGSNGSAQIPLRRSCLSAKYNYSYTVDDFDVLAAYVVDWDTVAFFSTKELFTGREKIHSISLRREIGRGNQYTSRKISDFLNFPVDTSA